MATAANEPGQWQMLWDSTMPELFNMFPDSLLLPNGPMTISQSGLWDLSGPVVEADGTTTERRFSDASQCSDDYSYVERQQSDSSLEHTFDPSQNPDCGETDTSPQTREAYPQHNSPSVSTRKRKGDIPDTCTSNNNQLWSSTRQAKSRRDRERNRVAAAKCRQKAKQSVSELQNRERELLQQNRYLTAHAGSLREEVINLKNEILRHSHCDSDVIQTYINKAAREIG